MTDSKKANLLIVIPTPDLSSILFILLRNPASQYKGGDGEQHKSLVQRRDIRGKTPNTKRSIDRKTNKKTQPKLHHDRGATAHDH